MDKHTAYFNLLEALPQRGCAICRLAHEVEINYITDVLYSKTTSVKTRGELREARGFCAAHATLLDGIGHALDVAIVYQDILMTLRDELARVSPERGSSRRGKRQLAGKLGPQSECPACKYRGELEAVYVETFIDHLVEADFAERTRNADPLCVQHVRQAIEHGMPAPQLRVMHEIQSAHWQTLIDELGEFIRKHDHRFRHERIGEEGNAWIRAVDAITGTRKF